MKPKHSHSAHSLQRRWSSPGLFGVVALCIGSLLPQASLALDVLTHMNDNNRSGANTSETILTPTNVNASQFGKLWSYSVNGATYAEPLYVSGVSIAGGTHNVVYLVTMEDDAYAFDADSNTQYWHVSFVSGTITPVPIADITGNNNLNIVGDVGIESTPYIDKNGGTIYMLARTKNTSNTSYVQTLHALDITTGAEKLGGPKVIATTGFDPKVQNQRMGLAETGSNIIIVWTSHEDMHTYHGWIMSYDATTLAQTAVFNDTPTGIQGGIWQQGRAPAVDSGGSIYVITGNGTWDGIQNFGQSFLKLSSSLTLLDWFTPDNWSALNGVDSDLGSGGAMLVPGANLVIGGGKEGTLYVCNVANLGHEQAGNGQVVQQISNFSSGEIHGGTVYWNSAANGPLIFNCGNGDHVKSYKFNGLTFSTSPFQTSSASSGGSPGGFLSISANGNTNGMVWATMGISDSDHGTVPGILRAFNADSLGGPELWDSNQNSGRDNLGTFVKDANPMIANGKVYAGSYSGKVTVYGLLSGAAGAGGTSGTGSDGGAGDAGAAGGAVGTGGRAGAATGGGAGGRSSITGRGSGIGGSTGVGGTNVTGGGIATGGTSGMGGQVDSAGGSRGDGGVAGPGGSAVAGGGGGAGASSSAGGTGGAGASVAAGGRSGMSAGPPAGGTSGLGGVPVAGGTSGMGGVPASGGTSVAVGGGGSGGRRVGSGTPGAGSSSSGCSCRVGSPRGEFHGAGLLCFAVIVATVELRRRRNRASRGHARGA